MTPATRTPIRIQRKRTKGWRMSKGAVYVGRGTIWGNPFRIAVDRSAAEAVETYRRWLAFGKLTPDELREAEIWWTNMLSRKRFDRNVFASDRESLHGSMSKLKGKNLSCWCPLDQPCHADVLLEVAN